MHGTLGWGTRLPFPNRLIEISMRENSDNTLNMIFDRGWQISFRIHNASSRVEPSLKFDIAPIGFPSIMSNHVIEYHRNQ